jgi:hypothetical protein
MPRGHARPPEINAESDRALAADPDPLQPSAVSARRTATPWPPAGTSAGVRARATAGPDPGNRLTSDRSEPAIVILAATLG